MAGKGLGRGLGALLTDSVDNLGNNNKEGILLVNINKVEPNKEQPRKYFDEELLNELASSIKNIGIIQPLIVTDNNGYYTIIAGERRWRAGKIAGIKEIPVIVKEYEKAEILQIALIENIQRADLNPIEEALCYKRLIDDYLFTQDDIAKKISRSRASVSVGLSLLKLDSRVQNLLIQNRLSISIAKLLLKVEDSEAQYTLANIIVDEELSVKSANNIIEKYLAEGLQPEKVEQPKKSGYILELEESLNRVFTTDVKIKNNEKTNTGRIEIGYHSKDELDRLLLLFNKIK